MPPEILAATTLSALAPPPQPDAMAEANHRIANNLALVAGMVRVHAREVARKGEPLEAAEVGELLEEIGSRIDAIARLHSLLAASEHGELVDLGRYLHEVSGIVVSSLTSVSKTRLMPIETSECLVPAERAVTIGLIVGEVVTNAMKYAHPSGIAGVIAVDCSRNGDSLRIEVTDDGVGLPENFDPLKNAGLGLRLVHSLAKQLGAKLDFRQSGTGLAVTLHIPVD